MSGYISFELCLASDGTALLQISTNHVIFRLQFEAAFLGVVVLELRLYCLGGPTRTRGVSLDEAVFDQKVCPDSILTSSLLDVG